MKEEELFLWLKKKIPDLEHSPGVYDGFDCVTDRYRMVIELKSRNTHYDDLLLEKKKYDFLINKAKELGYNAWYVNSTPKGVWVSAITDNDSFIWEERLLPTTTEFDNNEKIIKKVTFLSINKSKKIK